MIRARCQCIGFLIVVTGCGQQPVVVPVDGRVTIDGQVTPDVEIQFHRTGPGPPHIAIPTTSGTDGRFTTVNANSPGLLAGEYVVVFSKWEMPDGNTVPPDAKPGEVGAQQLLPPRYQSVEQRMHAITVGPQQTFFEFTLESK